MVTAFALVAAVVIVGLMAWLGIALYLVETLARPKKPARFPLVVSPFELDLLVEEVTFPDRTGQHQVSGWYLCSKGATTTILVCPGYRTRKSQTLAMILFLWKANYNVLAFEFYGHGAAVGTRVTLGHRERDDFFGALAYVKQHTPGTRIGVLAYSMGAAVAILCSAQATEVEALVADSAFDITSGGRSISRVLLWEFGSPIAWRGSATICWDGWLAIGSIRWSRYVRSRDLHPGHCS